jgi:HEAT repeat protein
MTALNLILIAAGAMLAVALLTVLAWLIHTWYLERVERRLAKRKGLYRELVSDLATRDRALLDETIHQSRTLYDLDALEAVLEEQARSASGRPGWLLEIYDELGLVDKYIDQLRSARKWRDRAFAAELLGRVGGAKAVPALLETVVATRTEDSDVREVSLRALARIADPGAVQPLIRALATADLWLAPRIADILTRHGDAVVDPLIAALNDGNHEPARAWAANVLGEVRAHRAFPLLVRLLGDPEDEVRAKAATALGRLGDRRAIGYLLEHLLTDPAPFVRVRIASSLGQFGGPEVTDRLVRALGDPAWWVRMRSVEALEQIGLGAEGPLLVALDDPDSEIRVRAAVALERLGVPDNLVRMIESGERVPEAYETLVKLATTGAREFLAELVLHPSRQVRAAVVTAIGRAQRRDLAAEIIQIAANDSEPSLRTLAFGTLRSLGLREALSAAITGVTDPDQRVRAAAVELMGALGGLDVVRMLRAQTGDAEAPVRAAAVRALGALGEATEADVRGLLGDPSSVVREAAVLAVAEARLSSLLPTLIELLRDNDVGVRHEAALAIGALGDRSVVPALLRAFPDPAADVSQAIAVAVSRLDLEAVPGLIDSLVESPDVEAKLALIRTLDQRGSEAIPVLYRLRSDYIPAVRAAAIKALGRRARRGGSEVESLQPALESGLRDPDELVRATAVEAWVRACPEWREGVWTERGKGWSEERRGNPLLTMLEEDSSPLVRERVALAIGLLRMPEGEEALIAATRRTEPANVRAAAVLAGGVFDRESIVARVVEMPDRAVVREFLAERLRHDAWFRLLSLRLSAVRQLEVRALRSRSDEVAQASLAQGMRSLLDAGERVRLIGSLRAFQGEQGRTALLQTVRTDPTPEVRTAALNAVGDLLEEEELLSTGARALGDPSVLVRRAAVELFTRASPARALPRLIQVLRADDDPAVLAAVATLAEQHFPVFAQAILALPLESERAVVIIRIARHIAHPDLASLLPPFARSGSPEVRAAVAELWRNRPDTGDPESLEALTLDPEMVVRRSAAASLAAADRYDLLDTMTHDPDSIVRREVAIVLGRAATISEAGLEILERLAIDADMGVRSAAYVARLLQGIALPLPPELDSHLAALALRESADLPNLRQTARTAASEERRLAAALALALLQDEAAREVARTDPAPTIRHRVSGALDLSSLRGPGASS